MLEVRPYRAGLEFAKKRRYACAVNHRFNMLEIPEPVFNHQKKNMIARLEMFQRGVDTHIKQESVRVQVDLMLKLNTHKMDYIAAVCGCSKSLVEKRAKQMRGESL